MELLPVELMNTVRADRDGVWDTIAEPADAARWLREARPDAGIAGWEAVDALRDLRDALRHLAAAATGDDRAGAATGVDRAGAEAGVDRAGAEAGVDRAGAAAGVNRSGAAPASGRDPAGGAAPGAELDTAVGVVNRTCALAPSWSELHWPRDGGADATPQRVARSAHVPALAAVAGIAEEAVALFAGPDLPLLRACHAPGCVLYFIRNHPRREWCSDGCGNRARVARHYQRHHSPSGPGSMEDD